MKLPQALVLLSACHVAVLGGCAGVRPASIAAMPAASPETLSLAAYGERVFRLQNVVMDELIDAESAVPAPTAAESSALAQAESHIIESCMALNEAAGLQMEGETPGWQLRARIAGSLARCNASVHAVRAQRSASLRMLEVAIP